MTPGNKLFWAFCVLVTAAALGIKFYFIPEANRHLELSIKDQMIRDVHALERIIVIAVTAAGTDRAFVRRALDAITRDEGIPVILRRSPVVDAQYGPRPEKSPQGDLELRALVSGTPQYESGARQLRYIYPLKARGVCQGCHFTATGTPVARGTVLGLAVKTVPRSVLHEASLTWFVMDLFWENLVMVGALAGALLACVFAWVLHPLRQVVNRAEQIIAAADSETPPGNTEWETIERSMDVLEEVGEQKKDT